MGILTGIPATRRWLWHARGWRFLEVPCRRAGIKRTYQPKKAYRRKNSRLPYPDGDTRWAERAQGPPPQGPQAPDPRRAALTAVRGLRGRGHFASIRAGRCQGRSGPLRIFAAANGGDEGALGLATPRMPGAVPRNRLRRRLRAACRGIMAMGGYDLIVSADPEALTLPFMELQEHVERAARAALARAGTKATPKGDAGEPPRGAPSPRSSGGSPRG